MATINPEVDTAVRFSTWYEDKGLSRSTAFRLLSISGIEPEKRRVEGSRSPVSFLSGDQQQKLDFLALELKNGKTLPELESRIVKAQGDAKLPDPAPEEAPLTKPSHLLQRLQALELAQRTGLGLSTAELSWLLGVRPGSSSFVRGNVVVERQARNCWTVQADLPG